MGVCRIRSVMSTYPGTGCMEENEMRERVVVVSDMGKYGWMAGVA